LNSTLSGDTSSKWKVVGMAFLERGSD
jgi:hypothetical protein